MNPRSYARQKTKGQIREEKQNAVVAANQFYRIACMCREMAKGITLKWWFRLLPSDGKVAVLAMIECTEICEKGD